MKKYYTQEDTAMISQYQVMFRKNNIVELKRSMSSKQSVFKKLTNEIKTIVIASYVVANLIAQKSKSYSDGSLWSTPSLYTLTTWLIL